MYNYPSYPLLSEAPAKCKKTWYTDVSLLLGTDETKKAEEQECLPIYLKEILDGKPINFLPGVAVATLFSVVSTATGASSYIT